MNSIVRISIQIPFCFYACKGCPHGSLPSQPPAVRHAYMEALTREVRLLAPDFEGQTADSIHLTGGIMAAVDGHDLDALLRVLEECYTLSPDRQIVLNVHPGTVNIPTVNGCKAHRVTAMDAELFSVGSRERKAAGLQLNADSMDLTDYVWYSAGFAGKAITICYGMPGQTMLTFRKTLGKAMQYRAPYLSLLPWGECGEDTAPGRPAGSAPGGMTSAAVSTGEKSSEGLDCTEALEYAQEYLKSQGYSAYAPGRFSKDSSPLRCFLPWEDGIDYIGFGLGAVSRLDGIRCRNTRVLSKYIAHSGEPAMITTVD